MRLTSTEEYGLRCLLTVARAYPASVSIAQVADAEGLSHDYAAKLLRVLRQGGLLLARRGAQGGFRLSRPAGEVTVWDALKSLDSPIYDADFCEGHTGQRETCVHNSGCTVRSLWTWVGGALETVLARVTLTDLLHGEVHTTEALMSAAGAAP